MFKVFRALDSRIQPKSRLRTAAWAMVRYGGSVLILILLFRFLPGRQVLQALEKLPPRVWILVIAAYLATHCLAVGKWRLMVNSAGAGLGSLLAARCYFAGLFGSLILPSLIGGDLVRAAMAMRYGRTKGGVLIGSALDRIIDFAGLILLALIGASLAPERLEPQSRRVFLWIAIATIAATALLGTAGALIPVRKLPFRLRRGLASLRRARRSMGQRPHTMFIALGISVVSQLSFIMLSLVLAEACGLRLPFCAWLFAWPLAKLSAAIPITQGGIGVREAALAGLLIPFGAPAAFTVAAGLAWEGVVIAGGLLGGAFAFAVRQRSLGQKPPDVLMGAGASGSGTRPATQVAES